MTTITRELTTLREAIESRDAQAVTAHYRTDATLTVLDAEHQPSSPTVVRGRDQIEAYYADVCGRNIEHRVTDAVVGPDRIAFVQRCRYPNGQQVVCATVADLADGLITNQTAVQVWDA